MNRKKTSMGRKVFLAVDVIVILLLCLICMVPLLNLLAYSFSASQPIIENKVFLWPKEFTLFRTWLMKVSTSLPQRTFTAAPTTC